MPSPRTILYPTDFSEPSGYLFQLACSLARDQGARLVVLYVAEPPPFITYGEMEKLLQVPDGYRQELETKLREFRPEDDGVPVDYRVVSGEPVAEILHAAEEVRCDLIAMGTHGRTGPGRVLLGSVAEQVVRRAPCPVLTVKVPAESGRPADAPSTVKAVGGEGLVGRTRP